MSQISRRKFLTTGSMGAAAIGTLAILPAGASAALGTNRKIDLSHNENPNAAVESHALTPEAFVVYIPDPRSGKLHYMVGSKEIVRQNKALVAQILKLKG